MFGDLNLDGKTYLQNKTEFNNLLVSCIQG